MSRPSREPLPGPAVMAPAPIDVRVVGDTASVGGVPVTAPEGEEIQHVVLAHLRRIAVATGHAVLATVHDERSGYVVPIQVEPDGSSTLTAEPVPITPTTDPYDDEPLTAPPGTVTQPTGVFGPPPAMDETLTPGPTPEHPYDAPGPTASPAPPVTAPRPLPVEPASPVTTSQTFPAEPAYPEPALAPRPVPPPPSLETPPRPAPVPLVDPETVIPEPSPKHTPARGFDAVAEAVLGDDPRDTGAVPPGPLAGPTARINEAVRAGRIDMAAELAERTVEEASGALGADHPEVLRLRELAAYIAYLAGDPVRAFHVSLDVAWAHRRTGDSEAAYGNVQSAATAWRAVREPVQGLNLGNELLGLWTALSADGGPAAEDPSALDSARSRMLRLAERAAAVR
ncbi:tetratricopeptide repeat protein [Streptomyces sp. NPDC004539]|uniref:tetratricopeptide repeat protein n=1 Tax=Streptomyces sp. NPDC004539 TaxID=3154280 RepID=UPI0033AFEEA0